MLENKIFKHDIYGKEVTVSKEGEGYILEGNERKVATSNAAYYTDTLTPELKIGLANELAISVGNDNDDDEEKKRPIGIGTGGCEPKE